MTLPEEREIWRARYRELEKQMHFMMLQTAEALETQRPAQRDPRLRIRKLYIAKQPRGVIICVADGENLDFRFILSNEDGTVLDTGFQRQNSTLLPTDVRIATVQVEVRSHNGGAIVTRTMSVTGS